MVEVANQWWVLFGVGQVGCGVEIFVWCGGNRCGVVVAMENRHGVVCVALLLAPMGLR